MLWSKNFGPDFDCSIWDALTKYPILHRMHYSENRFNFCNLSYCEPCHFQLSARRFQGLEKRASLCLICILGLFEHSKFIFLNLAKIGFCEEKVCSMRNDRTDGSRLVEMGFLPKKITPKTEDMVFPGWPRFVHTWSGWESRQ